MNDSVLEELAAASVWGRYRPTSLIELPVLAAASRVARVFVKVEGERPLGNFKVLGGLLAGLRAIARARKARPDGIAGGSGPSLRLICASDGNHGLAVAAAAHAAGQRAAIYLPTGVSEFRSSKIQALGADVVSIAGTYDDAVREAAAAAARGEGLLIPDTSTDIDDIVVGDVMEGYSVLAHEIVEQFEKVSERPSHLFVQAGVGGLAAAMADGLADRMRPPHRVVVVEPRSAPCVAHALAAGKPMQIAGDLTTSAEMLSCGLASAPAIRTLLRHGAGSVLVAEEELLAAVHTLSAAGGPDTTPSGAAGLAGLLAVAANARRRTELQLGSDSVVILIATEGALPYPKACPSSK